MTAGWLRKCLDDAVAEVASWPEWKRNMLKDQINEPSNPQWTCIHRHRCREAQTCNGKPCVTSR